MITCVKGILTGLLLTLSIKSSPAEAGKINDLRPYYVLPKIDTLKPKEVSLKSISVPSTLNIDTTIVHRALEFVGTPYKYGAMSKSGIDCSGLVLASVNTKRGKSLGSTARDIYKRTTKVKRANVKKGCLVFFSGLAHVGIMLDKHRFLHASSSEGVKVSKLDSYWMRRLVGFSAIKK